MCLGAPAGVQSVANESSAAYKTAINQAQVEFGDASTVFNDLMDTLGPIAKAGPGQTGWTAPEASAINAQTVDQTAAAYKNAASAVKSGIAAEGGGNIALPSGVNLGTEEALAEAGAQQESSGLRENTIANYNQGNQNWQFAEKGIQSAPGVFNTANEATNAVTSSGAQAFKEQQAVASYPTWQSVAMGALGAGLDAASAFIPGAGAVTGPLSTIAGSAVSGAVNSSGQQNG